MPSTNRLLLSVLLASALAACDRDRDAEVTYAPGAPLPLASPLATAPSEPSPPPLTAAAPAGTPAPGSTALPYPAPNPPAATPETGTTATLAAAPASGSGAAEGLQAAAQRLRESIQSMAKEPPGPRRNEAIRAAHQALFDANQAMVQILAAMRPEPGNATGTTMSPGGSGSLGNVVYPASDADYTRAMESLQKAAERLRESILTLARESAGPGRDRAISQAQQALAATQQAMIQLPREMRESR